MPRIKYNRTSAMLYTTPHTSSAAAPFPIRHRIQNIYIFSDIIKIDHALISRGSYGLKIIYFIFLLSHPSRFIKRQNIADYYLVLFSVYTIIGTIQQKHKKAHRNKKKKTKSFHIHIK